MLPRDTREWLRLLVRWLGGTVIGWVAGMFGAIVLSYLVVNLFYPRETNLIVGLCVGASAAWFQSMAVRPWLRLSILWIVGGGIIMGPPFVAFVVFEELSLDTASVPVEVGIGAIAVLGGLLGALLQAQTLRGQVAQWRRWVGATVVYWGLALAAAPLLGPLGTGAVVAMASGLLFVLLLRTSSRHSGDPSVV